MGFRALFVEEEPRGLGVRFHYFSDDQQARNTALAALDRGDPGARHPLRSLTFTGSEPPDLLSRWPIVISERMADVFRVHRVDASYHPVAVHNAAGDKQFCVMHNLPVLDCIDLNRSELPVGRSASDYPMDIGGRDRIPWDELIQVAVDEAPMEGHDLAFAKHTPLIVMRDTLASAVEAADLTGCVIVDLNERYPFGEAEIPVDLDAIAATPTPGRTEYWAGQAIDWAWLENQLVDLAVSQIDHFAKAKPDAVIYSFAFDCNAEYGQVFFAANTAEALRESALQNQRDFPSLYGDLSVEEVMEGARWSLGDYTLYADTFDETFTETWANIGSTMVTLMDEYEEDDDEPNQFEVVVELFLAVACRALIRLQREGAFDKLHTSADFEIACIDHDETDDDAFERLARVRRLSP